MKINYSFVITGLLLIQLFGCKKEELTLSPQIRDIAVINISTTEALSHVQIDFDGGAPVSARGVCWSTTPNPGITDNKTNDGFGTGDFPSSIKGLIPVTTYYLRAYAVNSIGVGYSNELTFTTKDLPVAVTDVDGNIYHSVTIGKQTWLIENLKTTKYCNGDPIPNITEAKEWSALRTGKCCSYENDENNDAAYGKLYNWYAVSDTRNIAPEGWHIPSADEWGMLINRVGGASIAGYKLMKDNQTGFTVLLGGCRKTDGSYGFISAYGNWWCSNQYSETIAYNWQMCYYNTSIKVSGNDMAMGYSVRCVKD